MTQYNPTAFVDTESGSQLVVRLNGSFTAVISTHKGATAPAYAVAGMTWLDDSASPWKLKRYDGADWIAEGEIDPSTNSFTPYRAGTPLGTLATQSANAVAITGGTIQGITALDLASAEAGAGAGPVATLDRNSASPAAADVLGVVAFKGRDSGENADVYAQIQAEIVDPTAASEDGELAFLTAVAGALAKRGYIRQGLVIGGPAGGDPGAGGVNAQALQVGGVGTLLQGRHTIWAPKGAMRARTTNGAGESSAETSSHKVMRSSWDFDASVQEFVQLDVAWPKGAVVDSFSARVRWSHPATATSFGVRFGIQALGSTDGDALDAAFGAAGEVSDIGAAMDTEYVSPETAAVTVGGSPQSMDRLVVQIYRSPGHADDTLAVDARLHGVEIFITYSAGNDA